MFGIGAPELVIIGVIILSFAGVTLRRRIGGIPIAGPNLVLRKFNVKEEAPDNVFVEIVGRASGLTGWLLTVIGFDAETTLKVSDKDISFRSSSLFGQTHQVAPLPSIASTHCGYSKPLGYLIVGIIFVVGGIFSGLAQRGDGGILFILLIIGVIFLIAYWLSKKMTITLDTSGGMRMGLSFKRSVIENVPVDIEKAVQAINIVNKKIIESQKNYILLRQKLDQKG